MASLVNFQLTRFANSIRFVVINIRLDYEAIVAALEKLHDLNKHSSDSKDQEHSRDAQRILSQIRNKQFCLHLSGLSDVYDLFGIFVNEVQKVNVLSHERYDNPLQVLDRMKDMKAHIDHDDCLKNDNKACIWPCYHKDLEDLLENDTYQKASVVHDRPTQMYQSRLSVRSNELEVQNDVLLQVKDNLFILIFRLENDLRKEVFPKEVVDMIEKRRFITDLRSIAKEIAEKGSILVASLRANTYLSYIRSVADTLREVPDSDIIDNCKGLLKKIEIYTKDWQLDPVFK